VTDYHACRSVFFQYSRQILGSGGIRCLWTLIFFPALLFHPVGSSPEEDPFHLTFVLSRATNPLSRGVQKPQYRNDLAIRRPVHRASARTVCYAASDWRNTTFGRLSSSSSMRIYRRNSRTSCANRLWLVTSPCPRPSYRMSWAPGIAAAVSSCSSFGNARSQSPPTNSTGSDI
jgi:hypothetical protein